MFTTTPPATDKILMKTNSILSGLKPQHVIQILPSALKQEITSRERSNLDMTQNYRNCYTVTNAIKIYIFEFPQYCTILYKCLYML